MAKEKKTLKELRKEMRYTQREVSDGSGVGFSSYVAYESGLRRPTLKNAEKLASFFKRRIEEIEFITK